MAITRRMFAGIFAAGSSALARTSDFVEHTVLKRPHSWQSKEISRPGYEWRSLRITVAHEKPIRIIIRKPGMESLAEITVKPTPSLGPYSIQSVVGLDAAIGLQIRIESPVPFQLKRAEAHFMIPAARIRDWVNTHHESLGAHSEMGPTWIMEEVT